jgi:hypothetical protein
MRNRLTLFAKKTGATTSPHPLVRSYQHHRRLAGRQQQHSTKGIGRHTCETLPDAGDRLELLLALLERQFDVDPDALITRSAQLVELSPARVALFAHCTEGTDVIAPYRTGTIKRDRRTRGRVAQLDLPIINVLRIDHPQSVRHSFIE